MSSESTTCPVLDAHRRLEDAHAHWHAVSEAYMHPNEFRRTLNALLQSLRSVVYLIERRKRVLPDGPVWISGWASGAKASARYQWSVSARDRVVHEEDLTLYSTANVRFAAPDGNIVEKSFELQADVQPIELMAVLLQPKDHPKAGVLTVTRRWVDNSLPADELLAVTAEVYDVVRGLVELAHRHGGDECTVVAEQRECISPTRPFEKPSCMALMDGEMALSIDLSTREQVGRKTFRIERDDSTLDELRARYGEPKPIRGDAISSALPMLELGRMFLVRDGERLPSFNLYKGETVVESWTPSLRTPRDRVAMFDRMAERIDVLNADG